MIGAGGCEDGRVFGPGESRAEDAIPEGDMVISDVGGIEVELRGCEGFVETCRAGECSFILGIAVVDDSGFKIVVGSEMALLISVSIGVETSVVMI